MKDKNNVSKLSAAIESAELFVNTEISKTIRKEGSKWCVYSKDGNRKFGCYDSKKKAQERLRQIEHFSKLDKSDVVKGLPSGDLEGGIHLHALERENSRTKTDGAHIHVFLETKYVQYYEDGPAVKEEHILVTDEDGVHSHFLGSPTSDDTNPDGEHSHTVHSYKLNESTWDIEVIELETTEDGRHSHELQVSTSSFDGLHTHTLDMPDGATLTSLTPGQVWEVLYGMMPQADQVPLPPSSLFAMLSNEQKAILCALYMVEETKKGQKTTEKSTQQKEDKKEEPKPNDYTSGVIQALKLPDPQFIMKRLELQQNAGMLSTKNQKVRIGKAQALVNELVPMNFKDSFLWGIVSHGEAQLFKNLDDLPDKLLDSVDPITRSEFKEQEDIYYLPISLIKSFDTPNKLDSPPKGRRFAGKVDLYKNVIPVLKCSNCETPFEDIGRTKISLCPRCRVVSNSKTAKFMRPEREVSIVKSEETEEERYVLGVVLIPNETDAQGDIYDEAEVRKAAHSFMEHFGGSLKLMHKGETLDGAAKVLETYISKQEESYEVRNYPKGTWFLATRIVDDGLWSDVKGGDFSGYSIGGSAVGEPLA